MNKKQTNALMAKINNLANALEDVGIKCSINEYTHFDNRRKCIEIETNHYVWGEQVCFCWYLDSGQRVY